MCALGAVSLCVYKRLGGASLYLYTPTGSKQEEAPTPLFTLLLIQPEQSQTVRVQSWVVGRDIALL